MAHEIAGIAECMICRRKFSGPLGIAIAADSRKQQIATYLLRLAEHIVESHPAESAAIDTQAIAYQGMLRLSNYKTTDPALARQRDRFRWEIHQRTTAARVTDETIRTKTVEVTRMIFVKMAQLGFESARNFKPEDLYESWDEEIEEVTALLIPLLTFLRDQLEEKDRYPNQSAQIFEAPAGILH